MTTPGDIAGLQRRLRQCFAEFYQKEDFLRTQWEADIAGNPVSNRLLERSTRRYLIDPVLEALGWNPADPFQIAEEARGIGTDAGRLYFDYLGLVPFSGHPILLVEAKASDAHLPPLTGLPGSQPSGMPSLIAAAIDELKADRAPTKGITLQWSGWLRSLRSYVVCLSDVAATSFRRAAITTGKWIVIFEDPVATFTGSGATDGAKICCFASEDEILLNCDRLYSMLHRESLVDTLPL